MDEMKYTANELCGSEKFRHRKDALLAILGDGEYTVADAEARLDAFMTREV